MKLSTHISLRLLCSPPLFIKCYILNINAREKITKAERKERSGKAEGERWLHNEQMYERYVHARQIFFNWQVSVYIQKN